MEMPALAFFVAAGAAAVADWLAVAWRQRPAEYVFKPAVTVLLVLAAALADSPTGGRQGWFVVALLLCAVGDVLLMLPGDYFLGGLGAFLAGHLAYIVGFHVAGAGGADLVVGAVIVAVVASQVGGRLVDAARRQSSVLAKPVGLYVLVIGAMVASAIGSGEVWAVVGAVTFATSDAILGWNRFVRPVAAGPVLIMVTYHLGQGALVLSLVV